MQMFNQSINQSINKPNNIIMYLQLGAVAKFEGAWSSFQRTEGHATASQRGNVAELVRTDGHILVFLQDYAP
jgi:hypothetical protein